MDTLVEITPERFYEGMTISEFVGQMSKNREIFEENYDSFKLKPDDAAFLRGMGRSLKALVLAEDWCGDVVRYLPAFARMAEEAREWEVRVFCRDENFDLADMWRKEGKYRSIPVIVFFDENWEEIGCYVEKPAAVYNADTSARQAFIAENPDLPDAYLPTGEMSETTLALYIEFIHKFRIEHRRQWQQLFVDEIRGKLEEALK
jgi:thiol-disulfide isomerase/thioredoxin